MDFDGLQHPQASDSFMSIKTRREISEYLFQLTYNIRKITNLACPLVQHTPDFAPCEFHWQRREDESEAQIVQRPSQLVGDEARDSRKSRITVETFTWHGSGN